MTFLFCGCSAIADREASLYSRFGDIVIDSKTEFQSDLWKKDPSIRYSMLGSLHRSGILNGLSSSQVKEKLGEPDQKFSLNGQETVFHYDVRNQKKETCRLELLLKNDSVTAVKINIL